MYLNGKDELVNNDLNLIILVNNSKFKIEFNSFYFLYQKYGVKKAKTWIFAFFVFYQVTKPFW
jgi:hypothetical protein